MLVVTTTDNAANMRRAGALLLGHFDDDDDEFVRQPDRPMLTKEVGCVEDDCSGQGDLNRDMEMRVNSCVCQSTVLGSVNNALGTHNAGELPDFLSDIDMLVTTIVCVVLSGISSRTTSGHSASNATK